jgi:flagellar assembly protein FliH
MSEASVGAVGSEAGPVRASLAMLGRAPGGFMGDPRFASKRTAPPPPPPTETRVDEPDPIVTKHAAGYDQGIAEARAEAEATRAVREEAWAALTVAAARLDAEQTRALADRLRETVMALCETALADAALDPGALVGRVESAAAMLSRADDDRVIRLHPDDLDLVRPRLPGDWTLAPDPLLPRGALRIEGRYGGVEDGPEQWHAALVEALREC